MELAIGLVMDVLQLAQSKHVITSKDEFPQALICMKRVGLENRDITLYKADHDCSQVAPEKPSVKHRFAPEQSRISVGYFYTRRLPQLDLLVFVYEELDYIAAQSSLKSA